MMTKFTFATQPRYDRTHGNITYSADSQPSRFSFNIRIAYIKTLTPSFNSARFNFPTYSRQSPLLRSKIIFRSGRFSRF